MTQDGVSIADRAALSVHHNTVVMTILLWIAVTKMSGHLALIRAANSRSVNQARRQPSIQRQLVLTLDATSVRNGMVKLTPTKERKDATHAINMLPSTSLSDRIKTKSMAKAVYFVTPIYRTATCATLTKKQHVSAVRWTSFSTRQTGQRAMHAAIIYLRQQDVSDAMPTNVWSAFQTTTWRLTLTVITFARPAS